MCCSHPLTVYCHPSEITCQNQFCGENANSVKLSFVSFLSLIRTHLCHSLTHSFSHLLVTVVCQVPRLRQHLVHSRFAFRIALNINIHVDDLPCCLTLGAGIVDIWIGRRCQRSRWICCERCHNCFANFPFYSYCAFQCRRRLQMYSSCGWRHKTNEQNRQQQQNNMYFCFRIKISLATVCSFILGSFSFCDCRQFIFIIYLCERKWYANVSASMFVLLCVINVLT